MSMFCKKALDHMKEGVCFGSPIVRQRNKHDLLIDISREMMALEMTSIIADLVEGLKFSSDQPLTMYEETIEYLEINLKVFSSLQKKQMINMVHGMKLWVKAVKSL